MTEPVVPAKKPSLPAKAVFAQDNIPDVEYETRQKVKINLTKLGRIDTENLPFEFSRIGAEMAYYSALRDQAKLWLAQIDYKSDVTESRVAQEYRAVKKEGEKTTEAMVSERVQTDPRVSVLKEQRILADYEVSSLTTAVEVVRMKMSALVSLSADRRTEQRVTY